MTGLYVLDRNVLVHRVDVGEPGCTTVAAARIRKAVTPTSVSFTISRRVSPAGRAGMSTPASWARSDGG